MVLKAKFFLLEEVAAFVTGAAFFTGGLPTAWVAKREVDARSNEVGAKAAVPAKREKRTTNLILIVRSV
jgi:hypothetical protein